MVNVALYRAATTTVTPMDITFVVSLVALAVSAATVWFTRRSLRKAKQAALSAEASALEAQTSLAEAEAALERIKRLRSSALN